MTLIFALNAGMTRITGEYEPLLEQISKSEWLKRFDSTQSSPNDSKANPGATLTTSQWWSVEVAALGEVIALNVFIGVVASFVGLYVGLMLRKPKKS
jgi:hypothetical protein